MVLADLAQSHSVCGAGWGWRFALVLWREPDLENTAIAELAGARFYTEEEQDELQRLGKWPVAGRQYEPPYISPFRLVKGLRV